MPATEYPLWTSLYPNLATILKKKNKNKTKQQSASFCEVLLFRESRGRHQRKWLLKTQYSEDWLFLTLMLHGGSIPKWKELCSNKNSIDFTWIYKDKNKKLMLNKNFKLQEKKKKYFLSKLKKKISRTQWNGGEEGRLISHFRWTFLFFK